MWNVLFICLDRMVVEKNATAVLNCVIFLSLELCAHTIYMKSFVDMKDPGVFPYQLKLNLILHRRHKSFVCFSFMSIRYKHKRSQKVFVEFSYAYNGKWLWTFRHSWAQFFPNPFGTFGTGKACCYTKHFFLFCAILVRELCWSWTATELAMILCLFLLLYFNQ